MKNFLIFVLVMFCISCSAQQVPFAFYDKGWERKMDSLLPLAMRSYGVIKLNETTLEEVQKIYGEGKRYKEGNKNYSPDLLCYLVKDEYTVVFQSGPLGGWSTVTAIMLADKKAYNANECLEISSEGTLRNIGNIKLHERKDTVVELLGQPTFKEDDFYAYRYEKKLHTQSLNNEFIYVTSGIEIGFRNSQATWVRVYWQESI